MRNTLSVPLSIYRAAGSPSMEGNLAGDCRTCGSPEQGVAFEDWVRPTFTDRDKLRPGAIICHACQFCFTDQNEPLAGLLGKSGAQRMRNYSHFVANSKWTALSKANKAEMIRLLLEQSPEVAVIADSGQKHIIFRAKPGWWQFEEFSMRPDPARLQSNIARCQTLLDWKFSKAEIASGRYIQKRIVDAGLDRWDAIEKQIRPLRGSPLFGLALFLAQKEETDN